MILRRLLPFLLCLLALFPIWANASSAAPAQTQGHEMHENHSAVSPPCHSQQDSAATDCEASPTSKPGSCDTGNCLMHCLAPLVRPDIAIAPQPGSASFLPHSIAFSSVTLDTPSRPPSRL